MQVNELRKLPEKELQGKIQEIRERLFHLGFKGSADEGTSPSEVRDLRKDIARIRTVLAAPKSSDAVKSGRMSRAERTCRNLRAACLKAQAAKLAAAPKPKPKKKSAGKSTA